MTRINTNISSINGQLQLRRNLDSQELAITRLSTGLRINTAKDDPVGMVASSALSTEITSTHQVIANSQRANQLLMTADSALAQVSRLLTEIRGLITEAANSGALTAEQIEANQLQIDASLEAIDRISNVTQFEGKHLLDGSLDFQTEGVDWNRITDLRIDQANFGEYDEQGVAIEVIEPATRAQLHYRFGAVPEETILEIGGVDGYEAFTIAQGASITEIAAAVNLVSDATGVEAVVEREATAGAVTVSSFGLDNDLLFTADEPGRGPGDIVVLYTADETGNPTLSVDYTPSNGTDPATVNVNLVTEQWQNALYHYNGGYDATSNNAFNLRARQPGTDFNGPAGTGITFNITDTGAASVAYDHTTGVFDITVDYGGAPPTSVNEIAALIQADPELNSMFELTNVMGSDGSGPIVPATPVEISQLGVDGGTILSTAEEIATYINRPDTILDPNPLDGVLTVTLPDGDSGTTTVTEFSEYAYYGLAEANNNLQFLGPDDTRPIRFVSTPGTDLSVDFTTDPPVYARPSLTLQGLDIGTTINIEAKTAGPDFDDVTVVIQDAADLAPVTPGAEEFAQWDPQAKTLTLTVNFTYRAVNNPPGNITLPEMMDLINTNPATSEYFEATAFDPTYDPFAPPEFDSVQHRDLILANGPIDGGSLSGGVESEGAVIIHLRTDTDGMVETTASDLIEYFDNPPTAAIAQDLADYGVSMSLVNGSDGTGLLAPTPEDEDIVFTSTGIEMVDDYASVVIPSAYGIDGMFEITSVRGGADYDGVMVQISPDASATAGVPTVRFNDETGILSIGIFTGAGFTSAGDVVNAINNYVHPTLNQVFTAQAVSDLFGIPGLSSNLTGDAPQTYYTGFLTGGVVESGTPTGVPMVGNSDEADTGLTFQATEFGSTSFVSVKVLNGAEFRVYNADDEAAERAVGDDINALINGVQAVGNGLTAIVNTSTLDMRVTVDEEVDAGDLMSFRITGGGMQIQLGIDIEIAQQARLGLPSIHTAMLGERAGRLYEIRTGGPKDLLNDVMGAAKVVEEVSLRISYLRGRIGAFQDMTLETNMKTMEDSVEALIEANSQIRDADFAVETSQLTRAEILVQSGMEVLSIANNTPRNVLSLLQNSR